MERAVEHGDMPDAGQGRPCLVERVQRWGVVQRRHLRRLPDRLLDLVGELDRLVETPAAVDDSMPDGVGGAVGADGFRDSVLNQGELEARGAGVDREDPHLRPSVADLRLS